MSLGFGVLKQAQNPTVNKCIMRHPVDGFYGRMIRIDLTSRRFTIFDMLALCRFYRDFYLWDKLVEVIGLMTGLETSEKTLKEKALDVATLIRLFNIREGLAPQDDRLPKFLHQPLQNSGKVITEAEMEVLLKDYYRLHGWDSNGVPPSAD